LRVLEIGLGLPVAFAGMVLAEQGHQVTRWLAPRHKDPLMEDELVWWWSMHGKELVGREAREAAGIKTGEFGGVIDNLRVEAWDRWGVDREAVARRVGIPWVSLVDDCGYRSTGAIASARSWWEPGQPISPDLAETTAGLMMAFKLLAAHSRSGLHRLGFAACLQKMVPAELMLGKRPRPVPLDPEWRSDGLLVGARAEWRGELLTEVVRDREWKRRHMNTSSGRVRL